MRLRSAILCTFSVVCAWGLLTTNANAGCGEEAAWAEPSFPVRNIDLEEVKQEFREKGLVLKESDMQSRCSRSTKFDVLDAETGELLVNVPLPDDRTGAYAKVRMEQIAKTPIEHLRNIAEAQKAFQRDVRKVRNQTGVRFHSPSAYPIRKRTPKMTRSLLMGSTLACDEGGGFTSAYQMVPGLEVPLIEYVPGRTEYKKSDVYRSGDILRVMMAKPEVLQTVHNRAKENREHCKNVDSLGMLATSIDEYGDPIKDGAGPFDYKSEHIPWSVLERNLLGMWAKALSDDMGLRRSDAVKKSPSAKEGTASGG